MKPVVDNISADVKKHIEYSTTFETLVDKNFF